MSLRHPSELDRFFAHSFLVQWVAIFAATWAVSGRAADLVFALVVGAAIASTPMIMNVWHPGSRLTRHVVAVAQILYGVLAFHLTAGKLGTSHHVLASLAFLALYRDPRVILTAFSVIAVETVGVGVLRGDVEPVADLAWIGATAACLIIACRHASVTLMVPSMAPVAITEIAETQALASAPTLPPPAPIHEAAVYSDLESDASMRELLESFVLRLRRTASELEVTTATDELQELAGQLRGAAASYGFNSISDAARALEEAVQAGGDIAPHATQLAGLCRRARSRAVFLRAA